MFFKNAIKTSKIVLAIVIVLVSSCKSAQKSSTTVAKDSPIEGENSLLWQVTGNGLTSPSYIFGTIHIIGADDFFLGKNVEKKVKQSKTIVLEMDLKNIDQQAVAAASLLPDNKTIKDYISPEDYTQLLAFFTDSVGISAAVFNSAYARMKPFFLQQMMVLKFLGGNTESYEMIFSNMADDNSISIEGLETLQQQLSFLDKLPLDEQIENLVNAIKNYSEQSENMDDMVNAYKAQDINLLHKIIMETDDVKDITNVLLDERNKNWIPKLENYFKNGSTFVAVGAGHLGGKDGVIKLLQASGYTVEPISME